MRSEFFLFSPVTLGSLVLSGMLLGGCASEKVLQEQSQPLQDQIAQIDQKQAATGEANLRAAQALADKQATRSAQLEARLDALNEALAGRIGVIEKRLNEVADQAGDLARQVASLQARQDAGLAANAALAARVAETERGLAAAGPMLRDATAQTEALKARQDASGLASNTLDSRMNQAEQRLNSLTGLVQEALAASAKEVFLANGREAFTVTLTEDKVLYPQNDPTLDSRDAAKLDELAEKLGKLGQEYHLDIQGHTTNNSTEDNNYNLGKARAEVVKRYLHDKRGISFSRMSTISYGANKPLDPVGGNNRRIFIRVLVLK
jgi:outer membrane protein OmpA-like peptidoglycan-associated protein/outer membrane murein-binding lipoprotein Lpp